jgi:hypothetical protein
MKQGYEYGNAIWDLECARSIEDMQIMGIRGWRKLCKEKAEWKKITEKTKTHSGL